MRFIPWFVLCFDLLHAMFDSKSSDGAAAGPSDAWEGETSGADSHKSRYRHHCHKSDAHQRCWSNSCLEELVSGEAPERQGMKQQKNRLLDESYYES